MKSNKKGKCEFCGEKGYTNYYRNLHHCRKCNRVVKVIN